MAVRGSALEWTDDDLDALVEISESDIERAAVMWRTHAPKEASDLLDAAPEESI